MSVRSLGSDRQVTRFGAGALAEVGPLAEQQGIGRALVVTDAGLAATPWLRAVEASIRTAGLDATVVSHVTPTPLHRDVQEARDRFHQAGCDGVVSLGGGSAHDVGKVVALLARTDASLHDVAHGATEPGPKAPHVAVNSTAGTGAERSSYAFITEEHGHEHTIVHHPDLVPEVAVLDPRVHATMPPRLTAATGLNALAHAIEAYLSQAHTEASDERALAAVAGIRTYLPQAVAHGDDLEARAAMAEAAYHAAEAFDEAGLGLVDGISLVVSSLFNVGHSTANGIILPYVMGYDALSLDGRAAGLCKALGVGVPSGPGPQMEACIQAVLSLKARVGLHESLRDRGLGWDDLYLISHTVLRHPFVKRNPRALDEAGLADIFLDAVQGDPPRAATA